MSEMDSQEGPGTTAAVESGQSGTPKKKHRARRVRGITAWILIVLASLLIPISVISVWAIRTVTNTDQYVATMAPLARNPVIVDHLATRTTDLLFSSHIVQNKVEEALPAKAKTIVTPIVNELHSYVYGLALKVFESPKFGQLWDLLNRHTHEAVLNVLTGKQSALTKKIEKGGAIVLNLTPTINQVIDKANARGITVFNPLKAVLGTGDKLGLTVVSKDEVAKFSGWFNLIVKLKWVIPVVSLVLAALGILIAVQRRKTLLRMAIGVSLVTVVILAGISLGRITFVNQATKHHLDTGVAGALWDTLLAYLKTDLRWTVLIAVLVAFVAWVVGPARYAVWIRSTCAKGGRWVAAQARQLGDRTGKAAAGSSGARRTGGWILEHLNGLRIVGVVVAGLIVVFGGNFTGWGLLVIVIVLAAYLGLLQLVAAWARKVANPMASPGTT
ncbi:MAG: hypothetical protein ACLQRH_20510 [Acidimicrobiales bacterium]